MKVLRIELQNFKKHEAIELDVNGRNIFLLGPNEAGKSSILDSIFFALNPAKENAVNSIPKPLKEGEKSGLVKIVVGSDNKQYTVTRKFTEGSNERKLTIVSKDGSTTSKVEMLEGLIGYQKVNPFEFVEWSNTAEGRRKQLQLIESLLPAEVLETLNKIKQSIAEAEEKQKGFNTERLSLEKTLKGLNVTEVDLLTYADPIDVTDEMQKLTAVQQHNSARGKKVSEKETLEYEIGKDEEKIADLKAQMEDLQKRVEDKHGKVRGLKTFIENNPLQDETPHRDRLNEANSHNARHTLVKTHSDTCDKLTDVTDEYDTKKKQIEDYQQQRREIISLTELPIDGITFDTEQVYLNGLPLHGNQISTSQIMKLSFAIALAMGGKPDKLKLICIPRGESLDNNSIAQLKEFLHNNPEWQAFVEEVDRNEKDLKVEYFETE